MPNDPIKAALVAAVDASFQHDGDGVPPPLHVRRERHWRVTHEIAAFLRAVSPRNGGRFGWNDEDPVEIAGCYSLERMAAAVERAAREAGG